MAAPTVTARALAGWEAGEGPLPDRLAGALQRALLEGRVALEARIPSERELAAALGVSRATVGTAYAALRADGWLHTRRGAGSVARLPAALRDGMAPSDAADASGAIDLRKAAPAAPAAAFAAAVPRAVAAVTEHLTAAAPAQGLAELRAGIAARHAARGVPTGPEQILVTGGALPGLWLVLAALLPAAPAVIVESPTYPGALQALRQRRARLAALPVGEGWDIAQLDAITAERSAAAAYLVPDFHNPTGRLMGDADRAALLGVAERRGLLLVVDETMADLDLREAGARRPSPLAGERVITLGSLSKAVWDGLQVGWIRASAATVRRLAAHPLATQLATPPLEQAIAAELLGGLDGLLEVRRRTLRERRDHLLAALSRLDGIAVPCPPAGGLSAWAALEQVSSARLAVAAASRGVLVDPGGRFAPLGGLDGSLRIPYSLPEPQLDAALERLAPLLRV